MTHKYAQPSIGKFPKVIQLFEIDNDLLIRIKQHPEDFKENKKKKKEKENWRNVSFMLQY